MTIDLAIVIPTLNEEKYIGKLLDSIAFQSFQPKEIVVIDAKSEDKTREEIKKRQKTLPQLKYFQVEKYTISRQRNYGAKKTTSSHLLFLDADVELVDPNTLEKYFSELTDRKPDIAAASNEPLDAYWKNKAFFTGMNLLFRAAKPIWPMTTGMNLYISRSFFDKVGGFDEEVRFAEDHEIVQKIVKDGGKFIFLNKTKIYTSSRRLNKEGRMKYFLKMMRSLLHIMTKGYKDNPTPYKYGHFR